MINSVVIKRYGNRRLYNGREGRYVTAEELRCLAEDDEVAVVIRDAQDGRDITDEIIVRVRH
jgi:polyhydroxyalkanoate synthesis regulator protein